MKISWIQADGVNTKLYKPSQVLCVWRLWNTLLLGAYLQQEVVLSIANRSLVAPQLNCLFIQSTTFCCLRPWSKIGANSEFTIGNKAGDFHVFHKQYPTWTKDGWKKCFIKGLPKSKGWENLRLGCFETYRTVVPNIFMAAAPFATRFSSRSSTPKWMTEL